MLDLTACSTATRITGVLARLEHGQLAVRGRGFEVSTANGAAWIRKRYAVSLPGQYHTAGQKQRAVRQLVALPAVMTSSTTPPLELSHSISVDSGNISA